MENFAKIISSHFANVILIIAGTIVPGVLTLAIYNRSLFLEMDIFRLIVLSFAIGTPTAISLFFMMIFSLPLICQEEETEASLSLALSENIVIFSGALIFKIFIINLSLKCFVSIIVIEFIIAMFMWFSVGKKGVEKAITKRVNE